MFFRVREVYSFIKTSVLMEHSLRVDFLIVESLNLFSKSLIFVLLPSFAVFLIFFFVRRDFSFIFLYGIFFSFIFIFLDTILNFYFSKIIYPFIISGSEHKVRDIFFALKMCIALIINVFFYSLYLRSGINYDYPVIIVGSVWFFYLFYIFVFNNYKRHIFFISNSSISFLILNIIFIGFKYLWSSDIKVISYSWLFFSVVVIIDEILNKIKHLENFFIKNIFFIIIYPTLMLIIIYKNYSNLFIFLNFFVIYLILFIIFKTREIFERYHSFACFFMIVFFFFVNRMFYMFIVGMSYEKFSIFLIMLLMPLLYYSTKEREYNTIVNFNSNISVFDKTEPDIVSIKKTFIIVVLSYGLGFKIAYDYLGVYFSYSDTYSFFSVIIPVFFFYLLESYNDVIIRKIENQMLNLIFNISVITFIFSSSIVICSYTFSLNFINLISIFYIYAFLTLLFSSRYFSYLISMIYLVAVYIIIYV